MVLPTGPGGKKSCTNDHTTMAVRHPRRKGAMKVKSTPRRVAQNPYAVMDSTSAVVMARACVHAGGDRQAGWRRWRVEGTGEVS